MYNIVCVSACMCRCVRACVHVVGVHVVCKIDNYYGRGVYSIAIPHVLDRS